MKPEQLDISSDLLSRVLGHPVASFDARPTGDSGLMSEIARCAVTYVDSAAVGPDSVIIKRATSDPAAREIASWLRMAQRECGMYRDMGRLIAGLSANAYHIDYSPDDSDFLLVLEDLGPQNLPTQREGCTADIAQQVLVRLATLHARTWGAVHADAEWCPRLDDDVFASLAERTATAWPTFKDQYRNVLPASAMNVAEAFCSNALNELRAMATSHPTAILHGDARLDNVARAPDATIRLIDWQHAMLGPPAFDFAHFVYGSIPTMDRRRHAQELIGTYHVALRDAGIVDYDRASLESDIRNALLLALPLNVLFGITPAPSTEAAASRREVLMRYFIGIAELYS